MLTTMAAPCHYALENALSSMLSTWKKTMSISGGILYNVLCSKHVCYTNTCTSTCT
jgi:hypothetical protein